jgi:hypothetical protein
MAVNHRPLGGNQRKVTCDLVVEGVEQDTGEREEVSFPFKAYDAPIDVDVLVSYEWLARNNVHVHPRPHGLTVERPGVSLWVAGLRKGARVRGVSVRARAVTKSGQGETTAGEEASLGSRRGRLGEWRKGPSNYQVRAEFYEEFTRRLKLQPTVDCFVSRDDAQCEKFFSADENSLDQ